MRCVKLAAASLVLAASFLVAMLGGIASSAPITVNNPSFETDALGNGGFTPGLTGWDKGCPAGDGSTGTFNPTTTQYADDTMPDGVNVAISNGPTISQVLTSSVTANTFYSLQAAVGVRLDGSAPTSHAIQLWAGSTMLGQGAAALPTVGTFRTASVQYFAKANDPLIG